MTFEQRWMEICISAKFCKSVASDLLDGTSLGRVILDPKKARDVSCSSHFLKSLH
jgi:hypothetical protein